MRKIFSRSCVRDRHFTTFKNAKCSVIKRFNDICMFLNIYVFIEHVGYKIFKYNGRDGD